MKRLQLFSAISAIAATCLMAGFAQAATFDPAFRISSVEGDCSLALPDQDYGEIQADNSYVYGSRIKVGPGASITIKFSDDNECKVFGEAELALLESPDGDGKKIVNLLSGRIEVSLQQDYQTDNSLLIQTPTASCIPSGGKFTVDVRKDPKLDFNNVLFQCTEGQLHVFGANFDIPALEKDDAVLVSSTTDNLISRIRNVKGSFTLKYKDAEGTEQEMDVKTGAGLRISRDYSPEEKAVHVSLLFVLPDGTVDPDNMVTYTEEWKEPEPTTEEPAEGEAGQKTTESVEKETTSQESKTEGTEPETEPETTEEQTETTVVATTTTTTTTTVPPASSPVFEGSATTTTTIPTPTTTTTSPSPTPVGLR